MEQNSLSSLFSMFMPIFSMLESMFGGQSAAYSPASYSPTSYNGDESPSMGYAEPTASYESPSMGYAEPTASYESPSIGYSEPTTSYESPSMGYAEPTASYESPSMNYSNPTAYTSNGTSGLPTSLSGAYQADGYDSGSDYPSTSQFAGSLQTGNTANIDFHPTIVQNLTIDQALGNDSPINATQNANASLYTNYGSTGVYNGTL